MISRIAFLSIAFVLIACSESDAPSAPPSVSQLEASAPAAQETGGEPIRLAQSSPSVAPPDRSEPVGERRFSEGTHYVLLTSRQPTSTDGDRVEVAEVFMYSCPACFSFDPYIENWSRGRAGSVNFVRIPAAWNAVAELHARAYYTAEVLGKLKEMHTPFFREFHVNGNYLDTEDKLIDFFARLDVDEETFSNSFNSFAVHTKLQRAKDLIARYRVSETPSVVVDGRYLTRGALAESYDTWFDIIDEVAAVEWAAR